jgi:ribosome-binding protein aMBF1 (putative translation factor)
MESTKFRAVRVVGPRKSIGALTSVPRRRSTEGYVTEDWAAVSKAIRKRVDELGWRQRELAARSQVSQSTVREIQHHTAERQRSTRTLEALSIALGWHPEHLDAVLRHHRPPKLGDPTTEKNDVLASSRLDTIEDRLSEIASQLMQINTNIATLLDHARKNG